MLCGSTTIFAMSFSGVVLKDLKSRFLAWSSVGIFRSLSCKCIQNCIRKCIRSCIPALLGVCVNVGLDQGFIFLEE